MRFRHRIIYIVEERIRLDTEGEETLEHFSYILH